MRQAKQQDQDLKVQYIHTPFERSLALTSSLSLLWTLRQPASWA